MAAELSVLQQMLRAAMNARRPHTSKFNTIGGPKLRREHLSVGKVNLRGSCLRPALRNGWRSNLMLRLQFPNHSGELACPSIFRAKN